MDEEPLYEQTGNESVISPSGNARDVNNNGDIPTEGKALDGHAKGSAMNTYGRKTVLIVEDNEMNRDILTLILGDEYDTLTAENGLEGLKILNEKADLISLILLDINMPVMDGYEMMAEVKKNPRLSAIPIIVTTANDSVDEEIRGLASGASDYVTKPYNNEVVRRRVESLINLREATMLVTVLEHDRLTGALSREFFLMYANQILESDPDGDYDVAVSDVENFKNVNGMYGTEKGDELLKYIYKEQRELADPNVLIGRINADVFAVFSHHLDFEKHFELCNELQASMVDSPVKGVTLKFGINQHLKHNENISVQIDRARLALNSIKYKYGINLALFDDKLQLKAQKEQDIADSMEEELRSRQFKAYYQPIHDMETGKITMSEALVRWIHPEFGFMNPGDFIPIFERTGFIFRLDQYMLEQVCMDMADWKKKGINPVPASINVSRIDFNYGDLAERIINTVDSYGIEHSLINIEVTESAYSNNSATVTDVVNKLRARGFKVEMDDFGSGYSSLVVLSELKFDILKLDMSIVRRMSTESNINILDFVIMLAKWLNMKTIAEGVETKEQLENLRRKGCNYAQGYYYSKPLPHDEYEAYMQK